MKVLLVGDLEDWILGHVGRQLAARLSDDMDVSLLYSRDRGFLSDFSRFQNECDVVHLLSSSDIIDIGTLITIPCAATLWHMVEWKPFERAADRIDALFVCSEQWRERVQGHVRSTLAIERMRFGLDTTRFVRDGSDRGRFLHSIGRGPETTVLGFAGSGWSNEGGRKGLDRLWECLGELRRRRDAPFVLRLSGPHWSDNLVPPELRGDVHVEVIDIESSMLPRFYSSLDYYICTSRVEGGPYPVLEAMSCQCTVISTLVGVVPEIVHDRETGFVLREGRVVEDFLHAIAETVSDPARRSEVGRAARRVIEDRFSWDRVVSPVVFRRVYEAARRSFCERTRLQRVGFRVRARVGSLWRGAVGRRRLGPRLRGVFRRVAGGRF